MQTQMFPHPDNVIVFISEAERRNLFEKPITTDKGEVIWLVTARREEKNMEDFYSQGLTVGTVVSVGENLRGINPGDYAIIDYVIDTTDEYLIEETGLGKWVSVPAVTSFEGEDFVIDANRKTPRPTVVHRKGELKEVSMLIAVVRNGAILPNEPYIVMEHVVRDDNFKKRDGMLYTQEQLHPVVERKVIGAFEGSGLEAGDVVQVEEEALFERQIEGKEISVAFRQDILMRRTKEDSGTGVFQGWQIV